MQEIQTKIQGLSRSEFDALISWMINTERERREQESAQEAAQVQVIQGLAQSGKIAGAKYVSLEEAFAGVTVPSWRDPKTDITKMYPHGAVVARRGRFFMSAVAGKLNSWEPGGDGVYESIWSDVTDEVNAALAALEDQAEQTEDAAPASDGEAVDVSPDGSAEHPWPFEVGRKVTKGQYVTYEGKLFRMAQNHTMVDHYRPGPGLESIFEPV